MRLRAIRWVCVPFLIILLAFGAVGVASASGFEASGSVLAQASPRPTATTPSPRPTPTSPSPRPTQTDPYPGGAGLPLAPDGNSYFRVSDTAPGIERDVASIMWIALAVLGLGLVVRWFFIAARQQSSD